MDTPVPITARDKLFADSLRLIVALNAEESKTAAALRHDNAALKELEFAHVSELDKARYTDGRAFKVAGAPVSGEPWAKSADAEAAVEEIARSYSEHEEMARREKERLKRFVEKREELLERLVRGKLMREDDWAVAAAFLDASGYAGGKEPVEQKVLALKHHPTHAAGLLEALIKGSAGGAAMGGAAGGGSVTGAVA